MPTETIVKSYAKPFVASQNPESLFSAKKSLHHTTYSTVQTLNNAEQNACDCP